MNVLVVGASRGIGLEFARQYRAAGLTASDNGRFLNHDGSIIPW